MSYIERAKRKARRWCAAAAPGRSSAGQRALHRADRIRGREPCDAIAREEIFGPVLRRLKWTDEAAMLSEINAVEYGLTCSIWTNDLATAHRTARRSRPATSGSTRSASISSARRSAASSNPGSAARSASRSCCRSRRKRTSTSIWWCRRRPSLPIYRKCFGRRPETAAICVQAIQRPLPDPAALAGLVVAADIERVAALDYPRSYSRDCVR